MIKLLEWTQVSLIGLLSLIWAPQASGQDNILHSGNFPDPHFLAVLKGNFPAGLSAQQASEIRYGFELFSGLCCEDIENMEGLQFFTGLVGINYGDDPRLVRLPDLSGLTHLQSFSVYKTGLTQLPGLPPGVQFIYLDNNNLSRVDVAHYSNLRELNLANNPISQLPDLPESLVSLNIKNCPISSIASLPNLEQLDLGSPELEQIFLPKSLQTLNFYNLSRDALWDISDLPNLQTLTVQKSNIRSIGGLPPSLNRLTFWNLDSLDSVCCWPERLETLWLINCQELARIPAFPASLSVLSVLDCPISYLPNLSPKLERLELKIPINHLPPFPDTLEWLKCQNTQLTSLPALPSGLREINCANNALHELPPLPSQLAFLDCSGNQLEQLPPLPEDLAYLYCANNQIVQELILPPRLKELRASNNGFRGRLLVPQDLTVLTAAHNQLNELVVGSPSKLKEVDLSFNALQQCPRFGRANLPKLDLSHNQIEDFHYLKELEWSIKGRRFTWKLDHNRQSDQALFARLARQIKVLGSANSFFANSPQEDPTVFTPAIDIDRWWVHFPIDKARFKPELHLPPSLSVILQPYNQAGEALKPWTFQSTTYEVIDLSQLWSDEVSHVGLQVRPLTSSTISIWPQLWITARDAAPSGICVTALAAKQSRSLHLDPSDGLSDILAVLNPGPQTQTLTIEFHDGNGRHGTPLSITLSPGSKRLVPVQDYLSGAGLGRFLVKGEQPFVSQVFRLDPEQQAVFNP
ncbi:MAG: hypothetical protein H6510_09075 [Acidobacteria bacterium]|nr:hypothetical protein [Acidobacteriota bacterium]